MSEQRCCAKRREHVQDGDVIRTIIQRALGGMAVFCGLIWLRLESSTLLLLTM
jgi:hypothetical protein